ncbi:WD40-repeat-containing domain protein [Tylopilus felleus]
MSVILVTGSYDHEIRFWEAWSGICSRTIARSGESGQVNRLAISPDKRLLAAAIHKKVEGKWLVTGSEDGTIRIWDLRSTQGELISCDQAGCIKQWDLSENLCSHELTPAGDVPIRSVSLASDGSCLVAGNNKGKCYVWKINEEKSELPRYQAVTKYLATCSADTTVKIWSLSQNYEMKQEKVLQGHQRWVWDCAFSADSAYLVTASSDHTARLWEMASGETVRQYNGHHKGMSRFCR